MTVTEFTASVKSRYLYSSNLTCSGRTTPLLPARRAWDERSGCFWILVKRPSERSPSRKLPTKPLIGNRLIILGVNCGPISGPTFAKACGAFGVP